MAGDTIKFLIEMRDGASKPLKKVGKAAEEAADDAKGATIKYTELASKLTLLGMAAKGATKIVGAFAKPLLSIAQGGIAAGAQMEGFETRLKVLMGSSAAAKERLDELFEIGSTTPFELPGLMEAEVNLRALGVNAEKTLPMVMDFAGAMGQDLASAAVEVGRAMQFGAGAVETIGGRSLRAQVQIKKGIDPLKMSVEEFREAMIETLTDPDGIFKGGTEKLAATFDGMVSNLQDAFFKFQKEVGEADLFLTAKATLRTVLELLDANTAAVGGLAKSIGQGVSERLLGVIDAMGKFIALIFRGREGFAVMGQVIKMLAIGLTEMFRDLLNLLTEIPLIGDKMKGVVTPVIEASNAELRRMNKELQDSTVHIDELRSGQLAALKTSADAIENIQRLRKEFAAAPTDEGVAGQTPKPTPTETKAETEKEKAGPTAEELEESLRDALTGTESVMKQSLESLQDLQYKFSPAGLAEGLTNKLTDSFGALTQMMGPAGGFVQSLSALGRAGSDKIIKELKAAIKGVITALVEVLPELIVEIPRILIDSIPLLIEGIFKAIPKLVEALIIRLPEAIVIGLGKWFKGALKAIIDAVFPGRDKREERRERFRRAGEEIASQGGFFNDVAGTVIANAPASTGEAAMGPNYGGLIVGLLKSVFGGKKHSGTSHIDRTGAYFLQAGEAVIPNSGTTTQGMDRRMGGRGGMNITINTNVVDQNAIRGLGRLLQEEFGEMGLSTSPIFNGPRGLG